MTQITDWIKDEFRVSNAIDTEFMDITANWNDFVDAWNEDFDWVAGSLFGGTKLTLVKVDAFYTQVPMSLNIPFFGDFDFWDFIIHIMYFKLVGNVSIFGFSIPIGNVFYHITRGMRVPWFGTDRELKLVQSEPSKFGGLNPGVTFKDVSYDMSKFWIFANILKILGPKAVALIMEALYRINRYREPKMKDIILRISPEGASMKFDDDEELSIIEKINYEVNFIKEVLLYVIDPYSNPLPRAEAVTTEEPSI